MRTGVLVPMIFGIAGVAVLLGLGKWQLDRLGWKEGVLADIEARISAGPVPLPEAADPHADRYLPVVATGKIGARALRVLVSRKQVGAGHRRAACVAGPGFHPGGRGYSHPGGRGDGAGQSALAR
jgi:surfeit locus 1 family protein